MSTEVVTVLTEAEAPPTRALDALTRTHLVERGNGRGKWRLHDLVRAFGVGVVAGDAELVEEGEAARGGAPFRGRAPSARGGWGVRPPGGCPGAERS